MHHHPSSWQSLPPPFDHHTTTFNRLLPCPAGDHHPFLFPSSSSSSSSSHSGLFKRVVDGFQFAYDQGNSTTTSSCQRFQGVEINESDRPYGIQADNKMSAQEMVDAKAAAASKSHSEAERRRRERINNHLTKLRSLLPNTTKTDKASLLAEVIQHVKELKRQTLVIAEQCPVPTEINELTIHNTSDEEGRIVIRASLCCEDRSDLLPDLIKTLKMLRLRTLKAEITTLGRRVKNVLFVTGEDVYHSSSGSDDNEQMVNNWISMIEEALKAVIEKTDENDDSSIGTSYVKRQRTHRLA